MHNTVEIVITYQQKMLFIRCLSENVWQFRSFKYTHNIICLSLQWDPSDSAVNRPTKLSFFRPHIQIIKKRFQCLIFIIIFLLGRIDKFAKTILKCISSITGTSVSAHGLPEHAAAISPEFTRLPSIASKELGFHALVLDKLTLELLSMSRLESKVVALLQEV
jgi:hypothetical protein